MVVCQTTLMLAHLVDVGVCVLPPGVKVLLQLLVVPVEEFLELEVLLPPPHPPSRTIILTELY